MAFLPGADDSPRAAGRQAGCTFSGSLLAAPASFPRQRCIMSESFKRVVLAYSGGLDTSVILKWLQVTYGCEVVTFTADLGQDRKSVVAGKRVSVRVDLGGRRIIKKKTVENRDIEQQKMKQNNYNSI